MSLIGPRGRHRCRGRGGRRVVLGSVALLVAVPTVSIVLESVAAAAPVLVQSGSSSGSGGENSVVPITATLGSPCTAGDTLIAFVTIGQANSAGGMVSSTPAGWQRLYEHSPTDTSPYQGWFALSNCSNSVSSATFSITAPNNSGGTEGSVVLSEYSGLPDPLAVDFATNDGNSSAQTGDTLGGESPASSGELTLTALSFYGGSPSSTTPSGWNLAGSETATMPAYTYYKVGTGSTPSATFSWSPSASFEVTMLALEAGPASGAPNVVQENQAAFSGQSSASVTLPATVGAGDAVVAMIGTNASAGSGSGFEATSVSGGGVTWQSVTGYKQSSNGTADVWVGFGSTGGSQTVTANLAGTTSGQMVVAEVSGIGSIDVSSGTDGTGTSPTAPGIDPHAGDFLVGLLTTNPSNLVQHPQPDWSTFSLAAGTYGAEWQSNVAHATESPTWNTSSSANWIAVQAAFRAGVFPSVSSVSPSSGPLAGGNSVTVTGSNFTGATAVDFGSSAALGFSVNSATSITATPPAGSLGTVDVTVTAGGNTSSINAGDEYSYVSVPAPVVTGLSPAFGTGKGGASVTVLGQNLQNASSVFFGSKAGVIESINGGGSSLVAITPGGTGTVNVTVITPGGTSATNSSDGYTYQGYWMVGSDGGVFAFGNAGFVGSLPGIGVHVNDIVGVVPTKDSGGYWMVGADGGVFAFGDAGFVGSLPGLGVHVNDIVAVVPTSTGKGYWMVGRDGGVFAFGDAGFLGSLPGIGVHVNDIVGVVPTSSGKGYWMVGADGGVFGFGDAGFVGSLPGLGVHVNDIVGVVPTSTGKGYWMVGRDGGVFAFGNAGFVGSLPGLGVKVSDIVGVVATQDSGGYWMVGADGGVFGFGDAGFVGSLPGLGVKVSDIVAVVPT